MEELSMQELNKWSASYMLELLRQYDWGELGDGFWSQTYLDQNIILEAAAFLLRSLNLPVSFLTVFSDTTGACSVTSQNNSKLCELTPCGELSINEEQELVAKCYNFSVHQWNDSEACSKYFFKGSQANWASVAQSCNILINALIYCFHLIPVSLSPSCLIFLSLGNSIMLPS